MIDLQIGFYAFKKMAQEFDGFIQTCVQKVVDSKRGFVKVVWNLTILEGSEKCMQLAAGNFIQEWEN